MKNPKSSHYVLCGRGIYARLLEEVGEISEVGFSNLTSLKVVVSDLLPPDYFKILPTPPDFFTAEAT